MWNKCCLKYDFTALTLEGNFVLSGDADVFIFAQMKWVRFQQEQIKSNNSLFFFVLFVNRKKKKNNPFLITSQWLSKFLEIQFFIARRLVYYWFRVVFSTAFLGCRGVRILAFSATQTHPTNTLAACGDAPYWRWETQHRCFLLQMQ